MGIRLQWCSLISLPGIRRGTRKRCNPQLLLSLRFALLEWTWKYQTINIHDNGIAYLSDIYSLHSFVIFSKYGILLWNSFMWFLFFLLLKPIYIYFFFFFLLYINCMLLKRFFKCFSAWTITTNVFIASCYIIYRKIILLYFSFSY